MRFGVDVEAAGGYGLVIEKAHYGDDEMSSEGPEIWSRPGTKRHAKQVAALRCFQAVQAANAVARDSRAIAVAKVRVDMANIQIARIEARIRELRA